MENNKNITEQQEMEEIIEGQKYTSLTFYFDKLTGEDIEAMRSIFCKGAENMAETKNEQRTPSFKRNLKNYRKANVLTVLLPVLYQEII